MIPVYKEINADLDTPVSVFLKIKKTEYSFLLESVEGASKVAHFSFLGSNPSLVLESKGRNIKISYLHKGAIRKFVTKADPLDEIKKIMRGFKAVSVQGLPRFYGGLVGYIGYDMVRFFEQVPDKNPDDLRLPDCCFMLSDTILIFDHLQHKIKIVCNCLLPEKFSRLSLSGKMGAYKKALARIESISGELERPYSIPREAGGSPRFHLESNFERAGFCAIVKEAKKLIKRGDVIQVVLSQRFKAGIERNPFDIYRSLRSLNPSPYMFFLKLNNFYLTGASPEMLIRCEDGIVQTRPIAGTRPRGRNDAEDRRLEDELLKDEKERAEHLMLVDLGRNDLGRVSQAGQVRVSEFMKVEKYSHVMHLVSEVTGKLDKKYDIYDTLRASFPAGTVSGSPKIRAMEIIDELEPVRRGPYAGCVGYFSFSHNMDTCITLRTIIIKGKQAYIQAGAGIVADSIPAKEYIETQNKAKALIEALQK